MIKVHKYGIKTIYNGTTYRSKLEAIWAKYFVDARIKVNYEPCCYQFEDGRWYVPDFWLVDKKMFIEVKPIKFDDEECEKAHLLAKKEGFPILKLVGRPDEDKLYEVYEGCGDDIYNISLEELK